MTSEIIPPSTLVPRLKSWLFLRNEGSEYHSGVNSFTSVADFREHISQV